MKQEQALKVLKRFFRPRIKKIGRFLSAFKQTLSAFASQKIPNVEYSIPDLENFILSLLRGQDPQVTRSWPAGSWCIIREWEALSTMPSDAQVDYLDHSTYIAIAILVYIQGHFPQIANKFPCFNAVLQGGLDFAAARRLHGHGIDTYSDQIDAIRFLGLGGVPAYLSSHSEICPKLVELLQNYRQEISECIQKGDMIQDAYGETVDFRKDFEEVLQILLPLAK